MSLVCNLTACSKEIENYSFSNFQTDIKGRGYHMKYTDKRKQNT